MKTVVWMRVTDLPSKDEWENFIIIADSTFEKVVWDPKEMVLYRKVYGVPVIIYLGHLRSINDD